jgi:hypothetical protein
MIIGLVVLGVIVLLGALFGTLAATGVLSGQGSTTTCTDSDDKCAEWASSGECDNNPDYMLTNCCASCDDEDTTTAVEDATTAAEDATTAAEDATTAAEDATTAAEDATTAADLLAAETAAEEAADGGCGGGRCRRDSGRGGNEGDKFGKRFNSNDRCDSDRFVSGRDSGR